MENLTVVINKLVEGRTQPDIKIRMKNGLFNGLFPSLDIFMGFDKPGGVKVWNFFNKWSDLFPAVRRPFCGHMLFAPRNSHRILQAEYGDSFDKWCKIKVCRNYLSYIFLWCFQMFRLDRMRAGPGVARADFLSSGLARPGGQGHAERSYNSLEIRAGFLQSFTRTIN